MNNLLLIIVSAIITGIAQQPLGFGWFAWFSIIPFIIVIQKICSFKDHLKIAFVWGFFYNLTIIYWIAQNLGTNLTIGIISMFSAVIFFSFNIIIIVMIYFLMKLKFRHLAYLFFPLIWVSVEYIRSLGPLANPWISLANTQIDYLVLIQNAEFTGIYGITFWLLLINLLGFEWLNNRNKRSAFSWLITFCFPWIIGLIIFPLPNKGLHKSIDITSVQPNVHLHVKRTGNSFENIDKLLNLSFPDENAKNRLIIWPETSTMTYLLQDRNMSLKTIQKFLLENNSELLTGLPIYKKSNNQYQYYNSIAHIKSDTIANVYHKMHLVPMGEYIPLSSIFPSLKTINLGQANFERGDQFTIFDYKGVKLAGMVCLESTIPQLNRQFVNKGAEVIFYVVNDGWYEMPPQPQQHARQTVFRAIEFRRPIIRCANTGITQIVEPSGNIKRKLRLNDKGIIKASIIPNSELTFYAKYGDVFAIINVMLLLLLLFRRKSIR